MKKSQQERFDLLKRLGQKADFEKLHALCQDSLISHMGIRFLKIDEFGLWGEMKVSETSKRPLGGLHGGATAAFAETLGSILSYIITDGGKVFGLELNINHLKTMQVGEILTGQCFPIHIGQTTHVHEMKFYNERDDLIATSRLTMFVA